MRSRVRFHGELDQRDPLLLVFVHQADGEIMTILALAQEVSIHLEKGPNVGGVPHSDGGVHFAHPRMDFTLHEYHDGPSGHS
jgi:hypothetical protein